MNENSKTVFIFLLGTAVGITIGYFLASDKKEEIIEEVMNTARKVKDNVENEIEKGKKFVDDLKGKVNDLIDNA